MQLKFKKICLLSTIIVYCASFLMQSNLAFFQTRAAENSVPRVNIVAILVDDKIYDKISLWLQWYAKDYVQQQLSETKALVMPLDLSNISAYDIHRMMENIYFDWLEGVNSSLIWLIMVWNIPFPVVNQDWYVFPTVYPYVDFENQKYIWDPDSQYFVSNNNPAGQAEIWHWLINYWTGIQAYLDFFGKIQKYMEDPNAFIWDAMWYEDFIASKEWFLNENFPYYRNKVMFGEDLWYQRYSTLMKKMFFGESTDNWVDIVEDLSDAVNKIWGDGSQFLDSIDEDLIGQLKDQWSEGMHTTKMIQQEIEDSFLADYDDLFSSTALSTMRENVLAWWRWLRTYENASGQMTLLANADNSSAMIQLKDTMYLWNQNLQWLLENLNELMEEMIDKKIEEEKYSMDIVIPLEYKRVEWKRVYFSCYPFVDRFENYYFGKNARLINSAQELSIYRGTYRNLLNLDGVTYDTLLSWDNPVRSDLDKTDVKLKSIWWSYDIFSNQAEWNRWYYMLSASSDYNTYEENKARKEDKPKYESIKWWFKIRRKSWPEGCTWSKRAERRCEDLHEFALRWWWWSSSINLNPDKVGEWRYELSWYDARNAWKTIYDMWWFQSLLSGEDEWMTWLGWVDWLWKGPQTAATNFKSYIKYSSLTEVEWWDRSSVLFYDYYKIYVNHSPDTHTWFSNMNYWDLSTKILSTWEFSKEWEKIFNADFSGAAEDPRCNLTEKYSFKTLSSIIKHDSTNDSEINWIDYDKYWDEWELWKNYHDIRVAYEDVKNDLDRIVWTLSWLVQDVKSNDDTMSGYMAQLNWLLGDLKNSNDKRDWVDSEISWLDLEISDLESELSSLKDNIRSIESGIEELPDDDSYEETISQLQSQLSSLRNHVSVLTWLIEGKQSDKDKKVAEKESTQKEINEVNVKIWEILSWVSNIIDSEKSQLNDIYSEIVWLFADNIKWTIEYIIYLEWWNPEDYRGSVVADDLPRVPFLPEWIRNITDISKLIQSNVNSLKTQYKNVYDIIVDQQGSRKELKESLKEQSDKWCGNGNAVSNKIDIVDEKMREIFTITSGDENQNPVKCYTEDDIERICTDEELEQIKQKNIKHLTENTAEEELNTFVTNLKEADLLFKNMIQIDAVWAAIIDAAESDVDFELWATKKWIDLSWMTGAALINQYAQWAQTDWENSTWARMNQELLAWASIHMSGMNILTADRPIDSPRYVSMQWVAWNEVKLIYPDLFKVEVYVLTWQDKSGYDIHELLTWWQIRENIVKYLSGKVDEYNQILKTEYEKASAEFNRKRIYYEKLESLDFQLATPDTDELVRPYNYFTYEDFENALWWSWMLDAISEMLYYQSLTNKKKLSTWWVADDIELIKRSFNINDRREWVLKDYLTEWTGDDFKVKNPLLVIPTYELSWYEVAYVNSNGKDYIFPTEDEIDTTDVNVGTSIVRRHQPAQQEEDLADECGIPTNWKLPLFQLEGLSVKSPWVKWFKCWWEYTKKHPGKIELTFDRSLGDVVVGSWFSWFISSLWKALFWQTQEQFTARWDQMTQYADDRTSLLTRWTWYDSDKDITQQQVEAQKHNAEVNAWWSDASLILKSIKISNSNDMLSDSNPSSLLRIESISNIGNVKVEFMWTWDWCIKLDKQELCNGKTISKVFNPKNNPFTGLVTSYDHVAWKLALDMKIYLWGQYIQEIIKYTVSPSILDNFEIKVWDEKTVAWMISPVEVIWYDKYNNRVSWWLEKYDITVSQWEFLKDWAYQPVITTNDFRDLRFYYRAPEDLEGNNALIKISKHSEAGSWDVLKVKPKNPYEQPLVDAWPVVWLNWKNILEWKTNLVANTEYRLTNDEGIYDTWWKLNLSKLQRLDVEIQDWSKLIDVDSQILVTSQNWLVYIWQIQKDWSGNEVFFETSKNYLSGGRATIYYYPTTVAWEEVINIDIPWMETRKLNLSIKPADWVGTQLVLEKDKLDLWDTMYIELFLSDKWWNLVDSTNGVGIRYDEDKIEFVSPSNWSDWYIKIRVNNWYGKYIIFGTWAWVGYLDVEGNLAYVSVNKHIFPDSGLNIMYLNYFWNDRWNQWWYFSDNKKHVENMMVKSNKIITTTTQLVSEDKIKKMIWKIEPWFKIWNPDNVSTSMSIKWSELNMKIWKISSLRAEISQFNWLQLTDDINDWKNYILFIPSDSNYSIDNKWVLFNSGERVVWIADWDVSLQLGTSVMDNGDNVWNLTYKWVDYGYLIIHYPKFSPRVSDFKMPWERYIISSTFTNWSTYSLSSVWIFDLLSNFELNTNYKSIQNSDELDEKIWFLWDFKNITLFGEWEIVGEATRKFWSEFVINLWDPVLSRKSLNENVYGTEYDGWIWQEIYTDPEDNIFGTYQIDFDSNGTEDLLVVYLNWSIKLAKNYDGVPDLRNMQELMRIAVPIKEVFVGDADGNKREDIIILTKNNQLRAYLNNGWMFDVDGNVACLNQNVFGGEISSTPSDLEGIFQIFVEDMNNDNVVDVITYDRKWYIKVFYWWGRKGRANYLSTEKYACDTWWYDREMNNVIVVDALWVSIDTGNIFDNSMLHWVWLEKSEIEITEDELEDYWIHFDPNEIEAWVENKKLVKLRNSKEDWSIDLVTREIMGANSDDNYNFDVSEASEKFINESAKFVNVTLYENNLEQEWTWNNYVFIPSSYLDLQEDKGMVWKNYRVKNGWEILQDGDIVTVTVTVKASPYSSFQWTFGDIIQGPRNLYYDGKNMLKWINFILNQGDAVIKPRDGNFAYIVDNIKLSQWEEMKFEYDLEYRGLPLREMEITYDTFYGWGDELPDIKLQSVDWCAKDFDVYINKGASFIKSVVNLQDKIDQTYKEEDERTEDYTEKVIDVWSDVNQLPWIVWDKISRVRLLDWIDILLEGDEYGDGDVKDILKSAILKKIEEEWLAWLNMNLNVDLSIFEDQTDAIEGVIDDITKWMCNGFQFGWTSNCKWLPVPFNQAFLAPWKYHLFWCWELPLKPLEWWLPVFFFPGQMVGYPIPIPWWLKWEWDEFLWVPWWSYPSFIRIYAAPTLTAQLWIAICLWPSAVSKALVSPFADLGGNCIVFAIKPQCSNDSAPTNLSNPYESYSEFVEDVRDSGVCLQSQKWLQVTENWYNSSPLHWRSYNSSIRTTEQSRSDTELDEDQVNDILDDIQKILDGIWEDSWKEWDRIDVKEVWDNALKWRIWTFWLLDELFWSGVVDHVYDKYFWSAKLTVADGNYVDYYFSEDLWIISLERDPYVGLNDSETKNSIMIWGVEVLWWGATINKIKAWFQQWLRHILIDKWKDAQIRYIMNQLTKMHVDVILPDLSDLMWGDLTSIKNISKGSVSLMGYTGNLLDLNVVESDYKALLSNEEEAMKNISSNIWSIFDDYGDNRKRLIKDVAWSWSGKSSQRDLYSAENVSQLTNKIWNPFEGLASLMNESKLINIYTEPLTIEVPMIFSEDINEYQFYLEQWLEENNNIMEEWKSVLTAFWVNCSKKPAEEQELCIAKANEYLNSFVEFEKWDWPKMVNKIYTNLMILQEYRNFPFEIYEWMHVIDRYMSEIASLVNNTVWYLSYWVVTNAERFVGYIDAITIMLNIIKTYQLVIDFSVEWSKRCGNCSRDTYDQYACKLSFLCNTINLPILQIPNFKLPDITIDLSSVDIWLDIILPEFNFQPIKISLPDLPNLPEPPAIWANINLFDLPDIPVLPEPPTLPELPSFIPEIEIELPILPPAPELPELPNEIEGVINIAKIIWNIYCIVKKQFGLVWEKSVKAKIEQITQRTYDVKWIDTISDLTNWSFAPIKNYWVDFEISSYVDLQFTMDDFYDFMDVVTKWINNLRNSVEKKSDDWMSEIKDDPLIDIGMKVKEGAIKVRDAVDWASVDLNIWMLDSDDIDLPWLTSDEIRYVDYDTAKNRLNEVLAYFKSELNNTTLADSIGWDINKIENEINKPSIVVWNTWGIENMRNEIMNYLDDEKSYYDGLANLINDDYDRFLAMVDSHDDSINNWNDEKLLTFNVQLFNLDPSTKETVKTISKTNPYRSLIENKQEIIDGYWNAINTNTSDSLWLTQSEYLALRNGISLMKKQISTLYSVVVPTSTTQLVAKNGNSSVEKSLVAAWEWARIWSNMEAAKVVDPSVFSNWIYEKMVSWEEEWKLTKVVNSDSFVEEIWSNFKNSNNFWTHDIILRDENSIYKKCAWQQCNWWGSHFIEYYMERISSIPYEETRVLFDEDTKLKIADWDVEVKNWKVTGQSYDILSFSWDLSDADAYLIKLVERIDYSYEKVDYNSDKYNKRVTYVLALPNWIELSDLYENKIKLELLNDNKKKNMKTIESLYWEKGPLIQVVYYDPQKDKADVVISSVDRKWYYWRISTLDLQEDTYYINSPWSNQVVAWKQAVWDDQPPLADQQLFRVSTDEVVSEWNDLDWYVWTNYRLDITWRDNVALSYINVSQDGYILDEKYTSQKEDTLKVEGLFHTANEMEIFDLLWIDQFWNKTEKTVTVSYYIPTIKITDVSRNSDWETVDITAELSQDIDEWNVSFQRRRWSVWKTMKPKYSDRAELSIWPKQKVVVWTGYTAGNEIAMYDKDDSVIALLNPDTSEIKIQSNYKDKYDVKVKVENSAVLYVYDKESNVSKFTVSIPTEECINIEVGNGYEVTDLPENWNMWMFNGWKVVHKDWDNILLASPTCHLYSEYWLDGTYSYDSERDAVLLTLFESSDLSKSSPIKVWLKTKPFSIN